ncbi:cation-translocating P-type ATPase [Dyadobacter jiangsuensis]|uniref:cation-translocating P-type ATPase n=1 Tax=Dyadobacter jiangsuensis TaxID=1591085 RepID=UPI000D0DEE7B|nr:cation-translocating P-type ATPase [Dyadobacter jiangsuensis]
MQPYYQITAEQAIEALASTSQGLTAAEVARRRAEFGLNMLVAAKQRSKWTILLGQFKDVMILILIVAAVISFFVGEHIDAYVIIGIIVANAVIGFFQEYNAEESMKKLQQISAQHAITIREGVHQEVDATHLVPGDMVVLEAGNIIPADGRLIRISAFKTQEAILTGESHAIEKVIASVQGNDLLPADQLNMVFKGTVVANGSGQMLVTSTGMQTEIGRIAGLLEQDATITPLQQRLKKFSKVLVVAIIAISVLVFGYGLLRGEQPLAIFMTALSLAVAALPEALPAVITVGLANGAARMVGHNALIRKLPAVETLGSVTYICTDKTGTLTRNEMSVEKAWAAQESEDLLSYACMLNNEVHSDQHGRLMGDPTETALVRHAESQGIRREDAESKYPLLQTLPFDSERMRMTTLHAYQDRYLLLVKGAPSRITEVLQEQRQDLLDQNREWARQGLRVLFFAYKIIDQRPDPLTLEDEHSLLFLGMAGMIDPPRENVIEAIRDCRTAGIRVVMITGDQPLTATSIAERLEIAGTRLIKTLTGKELMDLDDAQLQAIVREVSVYARVSPEQKLKIIHALQSQGQFVAMTGDGVNDAPSLKQADIGVAMGITGTDVAKEASEMVLLDDNFSTIVKAVKEGRRIYDNIRKFIAYVLSCNLGEILVIALAPVFGLAIPLLPIHILWINLVTDGLPGVALAAQKAEKGIMNRQPVPPGQSLFAQGLAMRIAVTAILMASAAFLLQFLAVRHNMTVPTQRTMVFTMLCIVQLGNALSVSSLRQSVITAGIFRNVPLLLTIVLTTGLQVLLLYVPALTMLFKTVPLSTDSLSLTALVSVGCIAAIELSKFIPGQKG